MSTINPFPLNIVNKVNNPQLEALLAQYGHQLYADAIDLNKIIQGLKYLSEITGAVEYDHLIYIEELIVEENTITIPLGAIWIIENVLHSSDEAIAIDIPQTSEGMSRIDLIVANNSDNFELIQGAESDTVLVPPVLPAGTVLVTQITINSSEILATTPAVLSSYFITKLEKFKILNTEAGEIDLHFMDQRAVVWLTGTVTAINSVEVTHVYGGKKFAIRNDQETPVTIKHLSEDGEQPTLFKFPDEQDFILKPREIIEFLFDKTGNYYLLYVGTKKLNNSAQFGIPKRIQKGCQSSEIEDVAVVVGNTSEENEKGDVFHCQRDASTIWLAAIWKGNDEEDLDDYIPIAVYRIDPENQQ